MCSRSEEQSEVRLQVEEYSPILQPLVPSARQCSYIWKHEVKLAKMWNIIWAYCDSFIVGQKASRFPVWLFSAGFSAVGGACWMGRTQSCWTGMIRAWADHENKLKASFPAICWGPHMRKLRLFSLHIILIITEAARRVFPSINGHNDCEMCFVSLDNDTHMRCLPGGFLFVWVLGLLLSLFCIRYS